MNSISIPNSLPEILKNYVKAAIRSQPEDIISWSAEYFKSTDESFPLIGIDENISTNKQDRTLFRILAFQLGTTIGTKDRIEEVWSDLSLDFNLLQQIYKIGKFHTEHVDMTEFLGITFGHWTKSLKDTILLCFEAFCKCLTTDGYFLHVDVACKLYEFLAKLDCSLPANVNNDDDGNKHRHQTGADDKDNGSGKPTAVKSCRSLDAPWIQPPLSENKIKSVSLESIFVRPTAMTNISGEAGPTDSYDHNETRYHVPGIGSVIPDAQVQDVIEYFRKCAATNGSYVYDIDIENDRCPPLDAI